MGDSPTATDGQDRKTELRLEAEVDIRAVTELHAQCVSVLDQTGDVTADCSAVKRIDTAALQCLCALAIELRRRGRRLLIAEPSTRFDEAVSARGLWEVISS